MIPGVIIAGTHSGVGKTTITLGIMALLVKAGFTVQGYKVGPDYLDPSFYQGITGRPGENLDSWMTPLAEVKRIYREGSQGAQMTVVEGVMGLFDGVTGDGEAGSTAEIAKILGLPLILVIDARSMARSVAPLIKGFMEFDRDLQFGGIIFNRVGSEKHRQILLAATRGVTKTKILGFLGKDNFLNLPERHLGLVPFYENPELIGKLGEFADLFSTVIEFDTLLAIYERQLQHDDAGAAVPFQTLGKKTLFKQPAYEVSQLPFRAGNNKKVEVRIGIAQDAAFGFYYQDNLRLLCRAGAELIPFSPLRDEKMPPNLDGVYIGGGYPELFTSQLAANKMMLTELKILIVNGLPTYAECGGLMYLATRLKTANGDYPMVGVLNLEIEMTTNRVALGYVEIIAEQDCLLLLKGEKARGHEFHYSRINQSQMEPEVYLARGMDGRSQAAGFTLGSNLLASYVHLHFASNYGMVERFVERCRQYRQ